MEGQREERSKRGKERGRECVREEGGRKEGLWEGGKTKKGDKEK